MENLDGTSFIVAIGMALFLEGAVYALFPKKAQNMMRLLLEKPYHTLRYIGIALACVGVLIIGLVKA